MDAFGVENHTAYPGTAPPTATLPPYLSPLTLSLTVNAYYVLFGLNVAVILFYLGLLMFNGGAIRSAKNILLLMTLISATLYQLFSAMDVTLAPSAASYLRFSSLSLTIIAFLFFQWYRTYPIIVAECSPASVQTFRIILFVTGLTCIAPPISFHFGLESFHIVTTVVATGVLTLDIFFAVVSHRSLSAKSKLIASMQKREGKAGQLIVIIAKYSRRATGYALLSLFCYIGSSLAQMQKKPTGLVQYVYCFLCILVNYGFFMTGTSLVIMKWKLDTLAKDEGPVESSVPQASNAGSTRDVKASIGNVKVSMVPVSVKKSCHMDAVSIPMPNNAKETL
ncbi:hypothetical protein HDU77_011862 [Chytriomyces hyalinus]|nr:hypothetical protein HDU77_011862 [Chytriomyces hyalinus]